MQMGCILGLCGRNQGLPTFLQGSFVLYAGKQYATNQYALRLSFNLDT
jgi:hypothetical protein